ncbi:MAG TPA: RNA polymerase sigma factor [Candidatus Saccharimonadales bacterium]|nr:RNA polymerase sigma factor [Candidatus Saccharimonadales bacterium]
MVLAERVGGNEALENPGWLGANSAEIEILINVVRDETMSEEARRQAFGQVAEYAYDNVLNLALSFTRSEEDARDVTQDAFRKAWEYMPTFQGRARFSTWLYRVTANAASTFRKGKGKREGREEPVAVALTLVKDGVTIPLDIIDTNPAHDPETQFESDYTREHLYKALGSLPLRRQQVIVLREIGGLTHKQIAERLDISETAAKIRLHRARKQMKDILSDKSD